MGGKLFHAAEAVKSGAADEIVEDGFEIIVGVMGGEDAMGLMFLC